jgi:hypothetical protein
MTNSCRLPDWGQGQIAKRPEAHAQALMRGSPGDCRVLQGCAEYPEWCDLLLVWLVLFVQLLYDAALKSSADEVLL